ncbi:MAG: hypothetical protein NC483_05395 [Ruminococcus sp.]|nr:hypothetical protein [Ruminococcus sp.]
MKRIIILLLLFIITITGCKKEADINLEGIINISKETMRYVMSFEKYEGDTAKDTTMEIKNETLTNSSATIIIKDFSGKDYIYDNSFSICKIIDNYCIYLKSKFAGGVIDLIAYMVYENNPIELEINWEETYGKLKPGEYKLIKSTSLRDSYKEKMIFSTDFTIE